MLFSLGIKKSHSIFCWRWMPHVSVLCRQKFFKVLRRKHFDLLPSILSNSFLFLWNTSSVWFWASLWCCSTKIYYLAAASLLHILGYSVLFQVPLWEILCVLFSNNYLKSTILFLFVVIFFIYYNFTGVSDETWYLYVFNRSSYTKSLFQSIRNQSEASPLQKWSLTSSWHHFFFLSNQLEE